MSRSLRHLDPDFRARVERLIEACAARGVDMRIYYTVRTPWEQARLWRQSRSTAQVRQAAERLREDGAPYLADVLDAVGPQRATGRGHVTDALPGQSWHQHGLAVDAYWHHEGRAVWSAELDGERNGYRIWREQAAALDLHWAGWHDWPHVQAPPASSPRSAGMSLAELSALMLARWGREE